MGTSTSTFLEANLKQKPKRFIQSTFLEANLRQKKTPKNKKKPKKPPKAKRLNLYKAQ